MSRAKANLYFKIGVFFLALVSMDFCFCQEKTIGLIKHESGSLDEGYILFSPLECKTTYLIDKCGRKIHSWQSNYSPGLMGYLLPDGSLLRAGTVNDTLIKKGLNGGIIEIINWENQVTWSYTLYNDSISQHHDIYPMQNGNILVIVRHKILKTEAISKGRLEGTIHGDHIYSEQILELKPVGVNQAEIVWKWRLWDHLIQDQDSSLPNYGKVYEHPELMDINYSPAAAQDWIHINSIDYNPHLDQILVSCKSLNEIWILDHSTTLNEAASHQGGTSGRGGDILYRWGNPATYKKGRVRDQKFFHQHNAHWIDSGMKNSGAIMVFNNGLGRIPPYSSVEVIHPPVDEAGHYDPTLPYLPETYEWVYQDPIRENFFSGFKSGASRLRNGNTLICSGLNGRFFEIDSNLNNVWEYINPLGPGDKILENGQKGNSVVFNCIFYPKNYSAFLGKKLLPKGTIERDLYKQECTIGKVKRKKQSRSAIK